VKDLQAGDPRRIGPYLLLGRLGSGGMGRVYQARSPGGWLVAVKVIRAELAEDPGFRARFAREVAAARRVGGLFTAPVVDADPQAPLPWLVTAYISGPSLAQAVTDHGPLPLASVLALSAGLAEGLAAVHAAGVVHRDLKPSNVLLAEDGPRVIDFGIAQAADMTYLTGTGAVVGSPGFMSPEQAEGREVGLASDMFSLGAVLAFAATGESPFGTGNATALLYRVVHCRPRLEQLPDQVRPFIEQCLAKEPSGRPSAEQFLAELIVSHPAAANLTNWLPGVIQHTPPDQQVATSQEDEPSAAAPVHSATEIAPADLPSPAAAQPAPSSAPLGAEAATVTAAHRHAAFIAGSAGRLAGQAITPASAEEAVKTPDGLSRGDPGPSEAPQESLEKVYDAPHPMPVAEASKASEPPAQIGLKVPGWRGVSISVLIVLMLLVVLITFRVMHGGKQSALGPGNYEVGRVITVDYGMLVKLASIQVSQSGLAVFDVTITNENSQNAAGSVCGGPVGGPLASTLMLYNGRLIHDIDDTCPVAGVDVEAPGQTINRYVTFPNNPGLTKPFMAKFYGLPTLSRVEISQ
jgi:serine/threonine protein kinase